MSRYLDKSKKSKQLHRKPTKDSRKKRMAEEQKVHKLSFEMNPTGDIKRFEDTTSMLFGVKGIGKSTFAKELGDILAVRYNLDLPATSLSFSIS